MKGETGGRLSADLGAFDFTLLVVGAVIGADVYMIRRADNADESLLAGSDV